MGEAVDAELRAIALQYQTGGMPWLARVIELRSRQPGASLYFVTDAERRADRRQRRDGAGRDPRADRRRRAGRPLHVARRGGLAEAAHGAGPRGGASRRRARAGRPRRERARGARPRRAALADPDRRADAGARAGRLDLRLAPRAEADRFDRRDEPALRGGRSFRAAGGHRHRRRVRPARRKPQHHAGADRAADARPEAGLRQYRARSEDAADAHAEPRRARARAGAERARTIAMRCMRRSRRPTS